MSAEITLKVTPQEFDYAMNCLGQQPYVKAAPLINKLAQQFGKQNGGEKEPEEHAAEKPLAKEAVWEPPERAEKK